MLCIPLGEVGQSGGGHKLLRGGVFIALDERSALVSPREVIILQLYTKALARW